MRFATVLSTVAIVAGGVTASGLSDLSKALGSYHVRIRQSSTTLDPADFPSQCQSTCTPIINALNSCSTASCMCTSANGNGLQKCVDCLISVAPSATMKQEGQGVLDSFDQTCASFGLGKHTVSGGTTGGSVTSGSTATTGGTKATGVSGGTGTTTGDISFNTGTASGGSSSSDTDSSSGSASNPFAKSGGSTGGANGAVGVGAGCLGVAIAAGAGLVMIL